MAADLGSVEFGVKADTSQLDAIVSAVGKVEAAVKGLQSTFNSMGSNASSAASKASDSTSDLSKAMETAAAKGKLFADALEAGLSKVIDLAKTAASSFVGLVESSVQSYASFEQSFGAADRFFKGSYEGATGGKGVMAAYNKAIDDSGTSFNDIGVSMQDFFDLSNQLLPRLVKDNAEARAKMEYEAKGSMVQTAEAQKAALDTELSQLKSNLQSQYDERKDGYANEEKLYKQQLDDRYDVDKAYWDKQLSEFKRNNEDTYNARKEELDKQEQALKDSLAEELRVFKQAKSDEYDALKDALTAQYNEEKSMRDSAREQLKQQLDDEYDALKDSLDNQYSLIKSNLDKQISAQESANQKAYDKRKGVLDKEYDELKKSLDKEVSAYQAATDARIKEIDREYTEKYKLIDEDKYKALKEIDDQINSLDKQTEMESRAQREREYNEKISKLEIKKINAESYEERIQAEQDYNDAIQDLADYRMRNERADQKEDLRQKREEVSAHYDALKSQLKEQEAEEKDAYKSQRADELAALKEHNTEVLKEKKQANDDALKQLKQDQSDQIAAMKSAEASILAAEKSKNDSILKSRKQYNSDIIKQQKQDDEAYLKQLQADNAEQLKEVKRANDDEIRAKEQANKDKLTELQTADKNELTQLQRDLADQYSEYEDSVKKRLKEIKRGYDDELDMMKAAHSKQLDELKEHNRKIAEEESNRIKAAKKSITGEEWKSEVDLTPTTEDYNKSLEQVRTLASLIADADSATDKGMQRMKLSILGGLYGRYATFDELNLSYRNKTGVQQMIEDAYAATRDESKRSEIYGSDADPFEGLELSADNAATYLQALTWAFKDNSYTGIAAEESAKTLSGAWRALVADGQNMQTMLAMSDEEAKELGLNLDYLLEDSVTDLGTFLFGDGEDFGGLTERVTNVLNTIRDLIEKDKDNPDGIPKKLAALFGLASEVIGEALAPLIESIVTYLTTEGPKVASAFYDAFKNNLPEESPLKGILDSIEGISTAVTTLGPLIAGVFVFAEAAQGVAALSGIEGGLAALSGAFTTAAGTISGVLTGIGTALATAFGPILTGGSISEAIGTFPMAIATAFGADAPAAAAIASFAGPAALGLLIAANEDVQRIVGEVFGGIAGIIGGAVEACSPILDTFKIAFDTAEGVISTIAKTLENIFRPAIEQIAQYLEPVATALKDDFKALLEKINDVLGKVVDTVGTALGPALEGIGDVLGVILEPFGTFVGFILQIAGVALDVLITGLTEMFDLFGTGLDMVKPLMDAIGELFKMLGEGAKTIAGIVGDWATEFLKPILGLPERVMETVRQGASDLSAAGKDFIDGFQKGAKEQWDKFLEKVKGFGEGILNTIKDALGIHSPSTKMAEIGDDTIKGFLNGVTETWESVKDFFGGILDKIKGFFTDPVGTLVETGKDVIGGLKSGIDTAWGAVTDFFGGTEKEVKGKFDGSDDWLSEGGKKTIEGFKKGIDESYTVVSGFFGGIDGALGDILENSDQYLTEEGKKVIEGLKSGIDNEYKGVSDFFDGMDDSFVESFDGSDGWLKESGNDVIKGLDDGIDEKWTTVSDFLDGISDDFTSPFTGALDWLTNAGGNIISGLYNGLVDAWNNGGITDFISGIGDWIAQNKGPEAYDKKLLVPAGKMIMGGLKSGLEEAFRRDVMPLVKSMAGEMEEGFGNPTLVANADLVAASASIANASYARMGADSAPQIVIQHMEVRSEQDIYSVSRELNALWKFEGAGSL